MSRGKVSLMPGNVSDQNWHRSNSDSSKVTLVESANEEEKNDASEYPMPSLSLARPKIGRIPEKPESILVGDKNEEQEDHYSSLAALPPEKPFGTKNNEEKKESFLLNLEPPRVWDSRFALFFVILLIVVNMGLIALVRHSHSSSAITQAPLTKNEVVAPVPSSSAPVASQSVPPMGVQPVEGAGSPGSAPPNPLKDLPGLAPSTNSASYEHIPPVTKVVHTPTPSEIKQLLTIINKE